MATAIRGAIILAKMSIVPVRRGYWGNKIGRPHTVPTKARPTLLCGHVSPTDKAQDTIQELHTCCLNVALLLEQVES